MNAVTVIDLTGPVEVVTLPDSYRSEFVHRTAISDAANGLLLAINGGPEAAGVVMLATSLGCTIKRVNQ
jgi:hypothetical protein